MSLGRNNVTKHRSEKCVPVQITGRVTPTAVGLMQLGWVIDALFSVSYLELD